MIIISLLNGETLDLTDYVLDLSLFEHVIVSLVHHCFLAVIDGIIFDALTLFLLLFLLRTDIIELELEIPWDKYVLFLEYLILLLECPYVDQDLSTHPCDPPQFLYGSYAQ
jgi:hypothetical protein